jgi:hypothetical protein
VDRILQSQDVVPVTRLLKAEMSLRSYVEGGMFLDQNIVCVYHISHACYMFDQSYLLVLSP